MMDCEKIRARIQKLLALGQSPNEYEAKNAILKARKLMVDYKLSERDIIINEDEKPIEIKTDIAYTTRKNQWYYKISCVVAVNTCCICYVFTPKGKQTHQIAFYGYEADVTLCVNTFVYAVDCIKSLIKPISATMRKDGYTAWRINTAVESFGKGFGEGLQQTYEKQQEENQEWGLVLVIPPKVLDKRNYLGKCSWTAPIIGTNRNMFAMGYEEGIKFSTRDKLTEQVG